MTAPNERPALTRYVLATGSGSDQWPAVSYMAASGDPDNHERQRFDDAEYYAVADVQALFRRADVALLRRTIEFLEQCGLSAVGISPIVDRIESLLPKSDG